MGNWIPVCSLFCKLLKTSFSLVKVNTLSGSELKPLVVCWFGLLTELCVLVCGGVLNGVLFDAERVRSINIIL